jgi:hypothetical protein
MIQEHRELISSALYKIPCPDMMCRCWTEKHKLALEGCALQVRACSSLLLAWCCRHCHQYFFFRAHFQVNKIIKFRRWQLALNIFWPAMIYRRTVAQFVLRFLLPCPFSNEI